MQTCPVCGGQGTLAKPPWIPGDIHEWSSASLNAHECRVCKGKGIINDLTPAAQAVLNAAVTWADASAGTKTEKAAERALFHAIRRYREEPRT